MDLSRFPDITQAPIFAREFLYIRDKNGNLRRFIPNRIQLDLDAKKGKKNAVLKPRQVGMTTWGAVYDYQDATTRAGGNVMMLAHDDKTTQRMRRIINRFWNNMPDGLKPTKKRDSDTLITFPELDSEINIATAGTATSGRGGTYTTFHGSEVAFWPDPAGIVSGALQGGNPFVFLESTPNGAQGYFYELCMAALDGNSEFVLHFYPWWWLDEYRRPLHPDYEFDMAPWDEEEQLLAAQNDLDAEQINWRRYKRREPEMRILFAQEYPEDPYSCFLQSDVAYFGDIRECWRAPLHPEKQDPIRRRYSAGLDWGQSADYTVLSIFDRVLHHQVYVHRWRRMPWIDLRDAVIRNLKDWRVSDLYAESNSMGGPNIETLRHELRIRNVPTAVHGFNLSRDNKGRLLNAYAADLQAGRLLLQNIPWQRHEHDAYEMRQVGYNSWQYNAGYGSHDDSIIANMAGWTGATGEMAIATVAYALPDTQFFSGRMTNRGPHLIRGNHGGRRRVRLGDL